MTDERDGDRPVGGVHAAIGSGRFARQRRRGLDAQANARWKVEGETASSGRCAASGLAGLAPHLEEEVGGEPPEPRGPPGPRKPMLGRWTEPRTLDALVGSLAAWVSRDGRVVVRPGVTQAGDLRVVADLAPVFATYEERRASAQERTWTRFDERRAEQVARTGRDDFSFEWDPDLEEDEGPVKELTKDLRKAGWRQVGLEGGDGRRRLVVWGEYERDEAFYDVVRDIAEVLGCRVVQRIEGRMAELYVPLGRLPACPGA